MWWMSNRLRRKEVGAINRIGNWLSGEKNSQGRVVMALSLVVGLFTGLAAFILKWLVGQIENLLTEGFDAASTNWLYLVYPAVGILLTALFIRSVVRDDISHGVTKILYALSRKTSRLKPLHHHRVWRFCRCRGTDCPHRIRHRQQPRQTLSSASTDPHAPRGMRCCRCCGRHLQGPYRRADVCDRGADA